ncbi:MAG: prepilin-type N-terminal cleavage/methylation domain-containing protein, partial [Zoogloea sp.]|nr:prepilin-type N-terminal cleavage/methylation domain-containing protein [Zoogloea sp.]
MAAGLRRSFDHPSRGPAPGRIAAPRRHAGFTLIEVMVVLVIMGLMATGISVGLDSLRGRDTDQA